MLVVVAIAEATLRESVTRSLANAGFSVIGAAAGLKTLRAVFDGRPDAVVLDLRLPDVEGVEMLRLLRAAADVPILALSPVVSARRAYARSKPARTTSCATRRRRRSSPRDCGHPSAGPPSTPRRRPRCRRSSGQGDLVIDREARSVWKRGRRVSLTRTEFRLLDALASRAGQVAPHRFLLATVWGEAFVDDLHYVRLYVNYLRSKLEDVPGQPEYILSEWGVGTGSCSVHPCSARSPRARTRTSPMLRSPPAGPPAASPGDVSNIVLTARNKSSGFRHSSCVTEKYDGRGGSRTMTLWP